MTMQVLNTPSAAVSNPTQTDHLWKIIEKQRAIIEELQHTLAKVTEERNDLLKQVTQPILADQSLPHGDASCQQSPPLEQHDPQGDFDGAPRPGFKSTLATAIDPTMSIVTKNLASPHKSSARQATPSPFDLMFSSNQSDSLSNSGHSNDFTADPSQVTDQMSRNQTTNVAEYDSRKGPTPHRHNPLRQQSAPMAQSADLHNFGSSFSQYNSNALDIYHDNSTSSRPSPLPAMVRYEDDYYDPEAEDYNNPGLSPPMSISPDTPYSEGQPATPPPESPSPVPMLTDIMVQVLSSNITTNEKGKDIFSFTIAVSKASSSSQEPEQLWCAEKLFSDFVSLDHFIKSKQPELASKLYRLPDKSLFLSKAPSKVDERKISVEKYIQNVLTLPLADMSDVCEFLSTNVLERRSDLPKRKLGYLTKRGKNFGGWKMRFFVMDGPIVNYYENKGGPYLGTINLARAQIGCQVAQSGSTDSYRHAFLILEPKKSAPNGVHRHVLCANSDMERDQWVEAMNQFINYDDFGQPPPPLSSSDYRQQLTKLLQRSTSDTSHSTKPRSKQRHLRQRSSLDDLAQSSLVDDDKKNKSRNFWGKKVATPTDTNLTHLLQGGLSPEQAMALMNSGELAGFMNAPDTQPLDRAPHQVFGIPLDEAVQVCRISHDYELPAVVYRCIEYLEAKEAAQEEGIYRLSGSAAKIKKLKEKFNQEGDVLLLELEEYNHEVHAIAGLLKMWLRELPGSVLTMDLMNEFLRTADIEDRGDRTTELGRLVSLLPMSNYTLLRTLSAHLIRVVQNSGVNKMTLRNLGIVFSATLGIPSLIFNLFISEFDYVFWTKHNNDQPILPPPTSHTSSKAALNGSDVQEMASTHRSGDRRRSNRNSIQYVDYAPQSIVRLENQSGGCVSIVDEDEEDSGTNYDQDLYRQNQRHQTNFANVNPTYEYTATVIEPPMRR